ncbi:MAG: hypothetical protein HYU35_02240 [Parcubacteria group bacterium]|nr:hypothetical protein [Parcubacteria group bacterium]
MFAVLRFVLARPNRKDKQTTYAQYTENNKSLHLERVKSPKEHSGNKSGAHYNNAEQRRAKHMYGSAFIPFYFFRHFYRF